MSSSLIIGLTGGIGSGKSAAAERFALLGIAIVDADTVAREVVAVGEPALVAIAERYGRSALLDSGELDRRRLREIIFVDPAEKAWLESLLHPIIRRRTVEQLQNASSAYAVLVSPLLLETDQHKLVDRVLVIDCDESEQITRSSARDESDHEQIKRIIATQMPRQERLAKADDIIHNHGSLEDLDKQIATLHQKYLQLADV